MHPHDLADHEIVRCIAELANLMGPALKLDIAFMMRKGQAKYACRSRLSLAEQFYILAA